jgi:hypothetical protein
MRALALALAIVVLPSCGDDPPADVGGTYDITVANDDDACALTTPEGASMITLSQDVDDMTLVTAEVDGAGLAPFLGITVGGTSMTGTLSGSAINVHRDGATRQTGGCTFHVNVAMEAVVSGDTLSGTITLHGVNNDNVDCEFADGCDSTQTF